jgi:predicted HNH restriction endonuclease
MLIYYYAYMKKCKWHICKNETETTYCSKKCKNKQSVQNRRESIKLKLIEYLGNECKRCGWKEHPSGLVAHHLDPSIKSFGLASVGGSKSWKSIKEEADKCVLLCANCHNVIHYTNDNEWFSAN